MIILTSNEIAGVNIPLHARGTIRYLRRTQGSWFSSIR